MLFLIPRMIMSMVPQARVIYGHREGYNEQCVLVMLEHYY